MLRALARHSGAILWLRDGSHRSSVFDVFASIRRASDSHNEHTLRVAHQNSVIVSVTSGMDLSLDVASVEILRPFCNVLAPHSAGVSKNGCRRAG